MPCPAHAASASARPAAEEAAAVHDARASIKRRSLQRRPGPARSSRPSPLRPRPPRPPSRTGPEDGIVPSTRAARIALVATFAPTIPSMTAELQALARARGVAVTEITPLFVPGAMKALDAGDGAEHDRLIADAVRPPSGARRRLARPVLDGGRGGRGRRGDRRQSPHQPRNRGCEAAASGGGSRVMNRRRFLAAGPALALAACAGPGIAPARAAGIAEVNGTRLYYEVAGRASRSCWSTRSRSTPGCGTTSSRCSRAISG